MPPSTPPPPSLPQSPHPRHTQPPSRPPPRLVHGALLLAQVFFGVGSIVGALGLPSTNPLAFALVREACAGAILLVAALGPWRGGEGGDGDAAGPPDPKNFAAPLAWLAHSREFVALGFLIFGNQAGYIIGVKMAGAVPASVWQPSTPVITASICMLTGRERVDRRRVAGVLVAFLGCAVMVVLSAKEKHEAEARQQQAAEAEAAEAAILTVEDGDEYGASFRHLVGNVCFLFNCLCTSMYIILSKRLLKVYPPLYVTAWMYNIASVIMFVAAVLASTSRPVMTLICPECDHDTPGGAFRIPGAAVPALVYFVLFSSAGSYSLMTWANRHVTGTLVMGYTVLQPVTAATLVAGLVYAGSYPRCHEVGAAVDAAAPFGESGAPSMDATNGACLDPPGLGSLLGMAGVFAGLALVVMTEPGGKGDDDGRGAYTPVKGDEGGAGFASEEGIDGFEMTVAGHGR